MVTLAAQRDEVDASPSPGTGRITTVLAAISLRCATVADARAVARLMAIAGEGIPTWLWGRAAKEGQDPLFVGTERAARPAGNFSHRNAVLAERGGQIAGMMLGYRLPEPDADDRAALDDLPGLLRPLVELEMTVPGSYYVNALAVFEGYRDAGIGTRLLQAAAGRATAQGCTRLSLLVFAQNIGAVRLYERNGYRAVDSRTTPAHPARPWDDRILLMVRAL